MIIIISVIMKMMIIRIRIYSISKSHSIQFNSIIIVIIIIIHNNNIIISNRTNE